MFLGSFGLALACAFSLGAATDIFPFVNVSETADRIIYTYEYESGDIMIKYMDKDLGNSGRRYLEEGQKLLRGADGSFPQQRKLQSAPTVLDFEGIGDLNPVGDFYNGGGGPGRDLGISFSDNAQALVDSDAGGTGQFENEPSPSSVLQFVASNTSVINVPEGFDIFHVSLSSNSLGVGVGFETYTGLDGTGSLLGSTGWIIYGDIDRTYWYPAYDHARSGEVARSLVVTSEDLQAFIFDDLVFGCLWCETTRGERMVLDFEGIENAERVGDFYNGGAGGDFGISFSDTFQGLVSIAAGGTGNFSGEPTSPTALGFGEGESGTINVPLGFDYFSFHLGQRASVNLLLFDGVDGTGNLLYSVNWAGSGGPTDTFFYVHEYFDGIAKSIVFTPGRESLDGFLDNLVFGRSFGVPDSPMPSDEPTYVPTSMPTYPRPSPSPTSAVTTNPTAELTPVPTGTSRECDDDLRCGVIGESYWMHQGRRPFDATGRPMSCVTRCILGSLVAVSHNRGWSCGACDKMFSTACPSGHGE